MEVVHWGLSIFLASARTEKELFLFSKCRDRSSAEYLAPRCPGPPVPPCAPAPSPSRVYLYSRLGQPNTQRQLLTHEDVRVVSFGEASLQLVQLRWGEASPMALLLLLALLLTGLAGIGATLGPRLLVRVFSAHRQGSRSRAHCGDVLARQQSGSFDWIRVGRQIPGMAPRVRAPHAQPAFHRLPVTQKLGGIFHT